MIFVDTGPWLARYLARDQHHAAAVTGWRKLGELDWPVSTSNFVLDETFTLLARRAGYDFAAQRARAVYASSALTILRPGPEEETEALTFFEKFADQRVSFTDCTSFALARRHKIGRVFTFDTHFDRAGFEIWSPEAPPG